jgi:hypothetical protein
MEYNDFEIGLRVFITENGVIISSNNYINEQKKLEKKYPEITNVISISGGSSDRVEIGVYLDVDKQRKINRG